MLNIFPEGIWIFSAGLCASVSWGIRLTPDNCESKQKNKQRKTENLICPNQEKVLWKQ